MVNVDNIDLTMAHKESPTTNRFYLVSDLIGASGDEYRDFRSCDFVDWNTYDNDAIKYAA